MVNIIHELAPPGRYSFSFDLDEKELWAIGHVSVQWAYLEHLVYAHTKAIADACKINLPSDALSTSFKRRLTAFLKIIRLCAPENQAERLEKIVSKIANLEQDRHKIVHGLWNYDEKDPDKILASSFRPNFEFEKRFDLAKIDELARRIGAVSFDLTYPNGIDDHYKALEESMAEGGTYAHISRGLLRQMKAQRD